MGELDLVGAVRGDHKRRTHKRRTTVSDPAAERLADSDPTQLRRGPAEPAVGSR